ncbi:MAG: VTT domain-containing protein [Chloracidobacterium sp.]|nr:VTT domain-containing protein [Chloracidobacterium sp.]
MPGLQELEGKSVKVEIESSKVFVLVMKNRYVRWIITVLILGIMVATAVALWRGIIPSEWLGSFGYSGLFVLSLINGIAPFAGPSQIATFFAAGQLNPMGVGFAAGIGGAIGELAGYGFGYFLRSSQKPETDAKIQAIANWRFLKISRERSFFPLLVLAAVPNPFFDPMSAIAGSLKIGLTRYFYPVVIGKTLRHLGIAYFGFYSLSMDTLSTIGTADYLSSGGFILAIIGIAFFAWLVRTLAESEPDPFLLNFTFFALAGQCILTAELARAGHLSVSILGLLLLAVIIVILQIVVVRQQYSATVDYFETYLKQNKKATCTDTEVEHWAEVLVRIAGIDFFPEFYGVLNKVFKTRARTKRRKQALRILPEDKFTIGENGVIIENLEVPEADRKWLWRAYALLCFLSWGSFVWCVLLARKEN